VSGAVVTLIFPARTEYLTLARLALTGVAHNAPVDQSTLADLKLAVTEACGNAVRHAGPDGDGVVRVRYTVAEDTIEIRVEDDGPGMAPGVPPDVPPVELSESGMGLAIIDALVDEVEIGPGENGRGTRVRMRRRLSSTPATRE